MNYSFFFFGEFNEISPKKNVKIIMLNIKYILIIFILLIKMFWVIIYIAYIAKKG